MRGTTVRIRSVFELAVFLAALPHIVVGQTTIADLFASQFAAQLEQAEAGDLEAQLKVAQAHQYGLGVEKNVPEAIRWYEAAADQSSAIAMYELGSLVFAEVERGDVSPAAKAAAALSVDWFQRAAAMGYAPAQSTLGLLYGFGDRVDVDRSKGRMWMEIAVINGHPVQLSLQGTLEKQLSADELALAKSLARKCIETSYTDCD